LRPETTGRTEEPMLDILLITATVVFLAVSVAFVNGCDRL
jgi:hypothetical protein